MKKAVILLGPTGVGKTGASLMLAEHLKTEIISSDSMQIYRHMDIGTAKPSKEEQKQIPHHMIDIIEPWEPFSTGAYISKALPLFENLFAAGKIPLITGGTGLYIKAMTRGIFEGPSADRGLRNELAEKEAHGPGSLYEMLQRLDAPAAAKIMPQDIRRTIRALEVCIKSGTAISDFQENRTKPFPYDFLKIGLIRERDELYRLIDERVDAMLASGLVDEVSEVLDLIARNAETPADCPAMQAIGYKELASYLKGSGALDDAVYLIKKRSRNYAKRQLTWFRKEEGIEWVDVTGLFDAGKIFLKVTDNIKSFG
ncbi:MAG: tRNA (adenosine(37)-N6)-dimethylallyltransferase MiaA [Nitrospirae bacterium]|nr:MAG: tRNA (adenosine(37)-N6)-dimethylallyltransferase MiaA [Nitrospirota bacterium]